ncbi:MAG: hypothetical protein ACJA04_001148, partial [Cellvibrionaceae bacterium]
VSPPSCPQKVDTSLPPNEGLNMTKKPKINTTTIYLKI